MSWMSLPNTTISRRSKFIIVSCCGKKIAMEAMHILCSAWSNKKLWGRTCQSSVCCHKHDAHVLKGVVFSRRQFLSGMHTTIRSWVLSQDWSRRPSSATVSIRTPWDTGDSSLSNVETRMI